MMGANVYITYLYHYTARRRVIYAVIIYNIIIYLYTIFFFFFLIVGYFARNVYDHVCVYGIRIYYNNTSNILLLLLSYLSVSVCQPDGGVLVRRDWEGNRSTRRLPKRIKIVIIIIFCPSSRSRQSFYYYSLC